MPAGKQTASTRQHAGPTPPRADRADAPAARMARQTGWIGSPHPSGCCLHRLLYGQQQTHNKGRRHTRPLHANTARPIPTAKLGGLAPPMQQRPGALPCAAAASAHLPIKPAGLRPPTAAAPLPTPLPATNARTAGHQPDQPARHHTVPPRPPARMLLSSARPRPSSARRRLTARPRPAAWRPGAGPAARPPGSSSRSRCAGSPAEG